ncbi:MAG: hypothetical protein ACOZNI_22905 [Myxococcota bacterium]
MFAVLGLDLCAAALVPIALIFAMVARAKNKWRGPSLALGVLAVLASLLPMCMGVGGYMLGMHYVESAVEYADPDMKDELLAAGSAEAGHNLNFGFGSGCCCLLPAVLALMLVPPAQPKYDEF